MAGLFERMTSAVRGGRSSGNSGVRQAMVELGVGQTIAYGGQLGSNERNPNARGDRRWQTAQDTLVNISIVAAGVRYYLNLLARPRWKLVPPNDTDEAKAAAEFADSLLHSTDTSWTRIVRRQGAFKFHGFGIHEWVAKRRDDGRIGFRSIDPRPPATIDRWELDPHGSVLGVWQKNPNGSPIYLPREKVVYLVDDALTDSPEGLGWYRHLIEPRDRMMKFLKLEKIGFERDLQGTPIGRAPYAAIRAAVQAGTITEAVGKDLTRGIEEFVRTKSKEPDTSLMMDSQPYVGKSDQGGQTISGSLQYGIELLTGEAKSIDKLAAAINRTTWDMALIIGVERLLVGREGTGSLALSEDTSQNLFLNVNSTLGDMAETYDRDLIGPAWVLNGLDPALRPTLEVEDAAFRDIEKVTRALADMAAAGAILDPTDEAINVVRGLVGLPDQPEMTPERMGMLMPTTQTNTPLDTPDLNPEGDE